MFTRSSPKRAVDEANPSSRRGQRGKQEGIYLAIGTEPKLSPETLAPNEGLADQFSLDIERDPDDPELQAELAKDIDFNDDSESGALTYLYRDGELLSLTTDESGQKRLVRNSEILHGDMLAGYQEAMAALAGGATDHSLEVRAAFLDTETEEFYSRQKLEFIDGNHVQITHELFSQAKEINPSEPAPEGSGPSYLDGFESFSAPESRGDFEPLANPAPATKPTESIFGTLELKPAEPQANAKPEAKPEPKPEPKVPFWGELSQPKATEHEAESRTDYGPLNFLNEPKSEAVAKPKPETIFTTASQDTKNIENDTENQTTEAKKTTPEAKKARSETNRKPVLSTEQPTKKPEQPESPRPDDSPEPTGGRAAEQPAASVAAEQPAETTTDAAAPIDIENIHSEDEAAPANVVAAETPAITTEAPIVSEDSSFAGEPIVPDATNFETNPVISESAPIETPAALSETAAVTESVITTEPAVLEAAPVVAETAPAAIALKMPAETIIESPGAEAITTAPDTVPIAIEPTTETATIQETVVETQTKAVEHQTVESPVLEPQLGEITESFAQVTPEVTAEQAQTDAGEQAQPAIALQPPEPARAALADAAPVIATEQPSFQTEATEAQTPIEAEAIDAIEEQISVGEVEETVTVQEFSPAQVTPTETVTPPHTAQAEPVVREQTQAIFIENDLSEEFSLEPQPAAAELTAAPIASATIPAAATATPADATVLSSEEGLDITMALDEPAEAPRRQTRTRPAHMTVGSLPAPAPTAKAPAEISASPVVAPLAPPEMPTLQVTEYTEAPATPTEIAPAITTPNPPRSESIPEAILMPAEAPKNATTVQEIPEIQAEKPVSTPLETIPVTPIESHSEAISIPAMTEPAIKLADELQPAPDVMADFAPIETLSISTDDIFASEAKPALPETKVTEPEPEMPAPEPAEILSPVVQNYEPKLQPIVAKSQMPPVELQSWAEDFGGSIETAASEPVVAPPNNHPLSANAENFTRPSFMDPTFASNPFTAATTGNTDDDDPGLIISFEQSERRHAARRTHGSRSTAA